MTARILIIEDNEPNLELMRYLLEAHGYSPSVARDGEEGLELIRTERPDLTICDLHIPKLDGFEVGRTVKSDPQLRNLPMVAVTALAMVGDREKVLSAGFDGYIAKPITPEKFVSEVERFLTPDKVSGQNPIRDRSITLSAPPAPHKGTILIIDDKSTNLMLGSSIFEPSGYRVIQTQAVSEVGELALGQSVDVVLTDMHMGDASAVDVLRALRQNPLLCAIPVLVISSSMVTMREEAELKSEGASGVFNRPIDPRLLLAEVDTIVLSRPHSNQEIAR
jgi:two-component system cell cycle response regulator